MPGQIHNRCDFDLQLMPRDFERQSFGPHCALTMHFVESWARLCWCSGMPLSLLITSFSSRTLLTRLGPASQDSSPDQVLSSLKTIMHSLPGRSPAAAC